MSNHDAGNNIVEWQEVHSTNSSSDIVISNLHLLDNGSNLRKSFSFSFAFKVNGSELTGFEITLASQTKYDWKLKMIR